MPIKSIRIKNCKSLQDVEFNVNNISCLLGENGTGKTNILQVFYYFYKLMTKEKLNYTLHDTENPYKQYFSITVDYDMSLFDNINFRTQFNNNFSIPDQFLKDIYNLIDIYSDDNKIISLSLKQYKYEAPEWNIGYNSRKLIKSLFPIYFIKCRDINLTDWESLWYIIGDLNKISLDLKQDLENKIQKSFKKVISKESEKVYSFIKNEFKKAGLNVKKFTPKEMFNYISQIQLGGNKLLKEDKDLVYFSDGVNSYGYLKFIISVVKKISEKKLKEPLLILDEPELSLHPNLIDNLSNSMIDKADSRMKLLISTHSPRIIKNVIRYGTLYSIFHLSLNDKYTKLVKMKNVTKNEKGFNQITDIEASFYFSQAIVFVEGDSDREIFLNKNILDLYPELKRVDFYHQLSIESKAKIVSPKERGYSTPYLMLVDLDKILNYNYANKMFSYKGSDFVNPLNNDDVVKKEKFLYGDKRKSITKLKNRINKLINQEYDFDLYWGYEKSERKSFSDFKKMILLYCLEYNIFSLDTTIEGTLINNSNVELFHEWSYNTINDERINKVFNHKEDINYKVSVMRLIYNGKFSNIKTRTEQSKMLNEKRSNTSFLWKSDEKNILSLIDDLLIDKTSGWITEFIDYFFDKYIEDDLSIKEKKSILKKFFPELSLLIEKILDIL